LPSFLDELAASGYAGINVTHPYKQAVIPLLDELSDGAQRVGAVNTIAFASGKRHGFNTDVTGFAASFARGLPDARLDHVFQAGAGGAGAATANAILELGAACLWLYDPDEDRAKQLSDKLCASFGRGRAQAVHDVSVMVSAADGVINATPIGMAEHPGTPVPVDLLTPGKWVADIVYFPLETELLRSASLRGCAVLDGGGMAVYQAAGAFEIFTGRKADADRMRQGFIAQTIRAGN
jgi:shikimate dehydrogenase